ncbi:RDD family protein [Paraflavitalea speifideaquila]|uniref:RDD family protein n=1 Tax=Paraflavitalea speifideaquila TaxID=3076558 RepID=UPI0028F03F29|nr:RDD family protein [Paraflavitalea speifideiaquila]
MQLEKAPEDLLADEIIYERASAGKRFANYIIDMIVFYALVIGFAFLLIEVAPNTIESYPESSGFNLLDRLIAIALYGLYMSLVETVLKGKSLGKYITQTKAVNLDGSPISAGTAFARGFSRAVPFCAFSALGNECNPWQDRWTNTMVINDVKRI